MVKNGEGFIQYPTTHLAVEFWLSGWIYTAFFCLLLYFNYYRKITRPIPIKIENNKNSLTDDGTTEQIISNINEEVIDTSNSHKMNGEENRTSININE